MSVHGKLQHWQRRLSWLVRGCDSEDREYVPHRPYGSDHNARLLMFVSMNASAEYRESDAPITYGFRCNVQEVSPGVFFSSVGDLASRLKAWLPRVPA